ncbi:unnamed protein product [Toxocara canis]|uniref:SHR-BD domain-containing protein n=1 Tax=Toxocara canis TaxID=6265 RepID=A0A183UM02_TOXCA|nr:unnamed protein product [Toxocara canis]
MAGGGRSCDGSEEVPCIAQYPVRPRRKAQRFCCYSCTRCDHAADLSIFVAAGVWGTTMPKGSAFSLVLLFEVIEVKQEYAVLCWRDAPDQLIQACQDAIVLSQRHSEYIPMRSVLKTGDVVSVRVQLTHPHAEVRWTALPDSLCVIKHTVIYEGVSKFLEGDENGSQEGDVSSYWPRVFSGDQMRFRAISLPDGSWRAVKVAHLFADDISDWKFPNSKGHTTTAVLVGIELPSFAKGLDGLVVTAVNNLFTRQNEHHSASGHFCFHIRLSVCANVCPCIFPEGP